MTKKIIVSIILGIVIIIVPMFYVLKTHQQPISSVFDAIPLDAGLIIDIKDYRGFRENLNVKNPLWKTLNKFGIFNEIENKLRTGDSIIQQVWGNIGGSNENTQIVVSLHRFGLSEFVPVYFLKIAKPSYYKQILHVIGKIPGTDITERSYEDAKISDIFLSGNKGNFSIVYVNGLVVLSTSPLLVENVVRHLAKPESVIQNKGLEKLMKSAGKNYPANFYIHYSFLERIGQKIIHSSFSSSLKVIGSFGGWAELDVNIKKDLFIFNGFTEKGKDSLAYMTIFAGQKPQKLEIFNKIPSNANTFILFGISDLSLFLKKKAECAIKYGQTDFKETSADSIHLNYAIDFNAGITSNFDGEYGTIYLPVENDSISTQSLVLVKIKSADDTQSTIKLWISSYVDSTGRNQKDEISEIKIDNETAYTIFKLPAEDIPLSVFGALAGDSRHGYCLLFDNYLVFGSSADLLKKYIQYCLLNNTINNDLEFNNLSDNYSSATNFFFYSKPSTSINFYGKYLKASVLADFVKNKTALENISGLVYQLSNNSDGLVYNNLILKMASEQVQIAPKALWESQLEGFALSKPVLVKNIATGETEIFVQDNLLNVYLLNSTGRILWKKNIGEPILSDIFQMDYYRNKKLQYVFNTATKIYMFDRMGNSIEKYPVTLASPATNGIAIFDYDNNRNYRIFVANAHKQLLLLDKDGKEQKGWDFNKTEGFVKQPVQYFRKGETDYIVFKDNRRIYILNRKGETRIKPERNFSVSVNNPVFFIPGKKNKESKFAVTDTAGKVHFIDGKGKISEIDFGKFSSSHFFEILDVNADNKLNYIFSQNNTVKVFAEDQSEISSIETNYKITLRPLFYEITYKRYKIGIVSPEEDKIYLYDISGNLHQGFPLKGSTQFSIGLLNNSENRFNLIVGTNKNFLYNYTVQ